MSAKSMLQALLAHRRWAMARIFEAAERLDDAHYRDDSGYGHGSLHTILFHVLRVDHMWRNVAAGPEQRFTPLEPEAYPDLASLRAAWEQEDSALADFVDGLSEEQIGSPAHIRNLQGDLYSAALSTPLIQLIMHGHQHRTEAAQILTAHGQTPDNLDFIFTPGLLQPITAVAL